MARTKADAGKKAGGKASRKAPVLRTTPASSSNAVSKRKSSGGTRNAYCKRPTPKWQKPIEEFLSKAGSSKESASGAPKEVSTLNRNNKKEFNEESACENASGSNDFQEVTVSSGEEMEDEKENCEDVESEEENGEKMEGEEEDGKEVEGKKKNGKEVEGEGENCEEVEGEEENSEEVEGEEESSEAEGEEESSEAEGKEESSEEVEGEEENSEEVEGEEENSEEMEEEEENDGNIQDVSVNEEDDGQVSEVAAKRKTSNGTCKDLSQIPETPHEELDEN